MEEVVFTYEHIRGTGDGSSDSFDFTAAGETLEVGLLLPAVQAAPEGPRPAQGDANEDSFEFKAAEDGGAAATDEGHDWIPILDISKGTREPASDADEAYLADYVAPLEIDDGKSHHDAWQDGG